MKKNKPNIIDYLTAGADITLFNPYLKEIHEFIHDHNHLDGEELSMALMKMRSQLIMKYSFAIPTEDILDFIGNYSPIIEIGSGSGYWAMCLTENGTDIIAVDKNPPEETVPWDPFSGNQWFEEEWFPVEEGDARTAGAYPERTLLLCWPTIEDPMADNALEYYIKGGGERVIFIGDPSSSGNENFHRKLRSLKLIEKRYTASWPGIDEEAAVYSI